MPDVRALNTKYAILLLLGLGLALRLAFFFFHPGDAYHENIVHTTDGQLYDKLTKSLLQGEGLAVDGKHSARIPPTYPFFMALCYSLHSQQVIAVRLAQILLSLLTCLILYFTARQLVSESLALMVLAVSVVYYPFIQMPCYIMTETVFIFLFVSSLYLAVRTTLKPNKITAILMGVVCGLAVLTRPVGLIIFLAIPFMLSGNHRRQRFVSVGLALLSFILIWGGWPIRNYHVMGKAVPFSTNGGMNLYRGNHDQATGGSGGWNRQGIDTGPLPSPPNLGEVGLHHYLKDEGVRFIKENPRRYLQLCWRRTVNMWRFYYDTSHPIARILMTASDVFVYPFALIGLWFAMRSGGEKRKLWMMLLILFLVYNIGFITSISVIRYRYPIMPIVMLFAAMGLTRLLPSHVRESTVRQKT